MGHDFGADGLIQTQGQQWIRFLPFVAKNLKSREVVAEFYASQCRACLHRRIV